jgi:hypothetical protein
MRHILQYLGFDKTATDASDRFVGNRTNFRDTAALRVVRYVRRLRVVPY